MSTKYKHGDRVPTEVLAARLDELSYVVAKQGAEPSRFRSEFSMRIPAELDRDADLVLSEAAERLQALAWLEENACDLRCIDVPTGGDDSDVQWIVVEHYMSEPHERIIGRGETPDQAVKDAMKPKGDPTRWDHCPAELPNGD